MKKLLQLLLLSAISLSVNAGPVTNSAFKPPVPIRVVCIYKVSDTQTVNLYAMTSMEYRPREKVGEFTGITSVYLGPGRVVILGDAIQKIESRLKECLNGE